MRMLNSQSSRFTRSLNYTAPEYRSHSLHSARTRLSLVAPTHPERGKENPAPKGKNRS
jgi:hypothetical protein